MENAAHTPQASFNDLATNDYYKIPVTDKQLRFARQIAEKASLVLPWEVQQDRRALSAWIDRHLQKPKKTEFSRYPSSKQVAYAERIARLKRRDVPRECFHDKTMMSRWIDSNQ